MDSDVLFIVSTLIRRLVWDMAEEHSNIRQLFVETHNIYFHKEVSLDRNFPKGMKAKTTFWTVMKCYGVISKELQQIQS